MSFIPLWFNCLLNRFTQEQMKNVPQGAKKEHFQVFFLKVFFSRGFFTASFLGMTLYNTLPNYERKV